jgi:hypothetical protein
MDKLSVSSEYFLVETESQAARVTVNMYSVIARDETGKTRVVSRSQGVY